MSAPTKSIAAASPSKSVLVSEAVPIDRDCTGLRWRATDTSALARLIAMMAMGQAGYAAHILATLSPAGPKINTAQLRAEAKIKLTVEDPPKKPRCGYPRWQRDGLIFEAISWLVARQTHPAGLLKAPHVSATTQGLDGLMIELNSGKTAIARTTIFEDKCTDDPRNMFLGKVLPEFKKRHNNERSAEIISAAVALIQAAGLDEVTATEFAAAVTDPSLRYYRASFAIDVDSEAERKRLFADYSRITNVKAEQRIGATLVVPPKMRNWFDALANQALNYLAGLDGA
ncbi:MULTISPECIES: hypothetical protein [unclassified Bradyrhizobium]|uniref:hypothetical protein n=1 Tax=unclassified Bradyrhizobium TaxID=2631580 RepID=UPI002916480F|nr:MULTISPECIES: hypothetical protein [unclassified Bradyrhizobium]